MKEFIVKKWVPDVELEEALNDPDYRPYRMFRNDASNGTPETTTIVMRMKKWLPNAQS